MQQVNFRLGLDKRGATILTKIGKDNQSFRIGMEWKKDRSETIYALIYDQFDPAKRQKMVLSLHRSRITAQKALEKRWKKMKRRVWECKTRIVWVEGQVRAGETITPDRFDTWAPGEEIPESEKIPDGD